MCSSWEAVFQLDVDVSVGLGSVTLSQSPLPLPLPQMMESSLFSMITVYGVTSMNTHTLAVTLVTVGILPDPLQAFSVCLVCHAYLVKSRAIESYYFSFIGL